MGREVTDQRTQVVEKAPAPQPAPDGSAPSPDAPAAPPSRRGALLRSGFIVGMLVIVFGVILPQAIDYQEVVAAFAALDVSQIALITALGIAAWFVAGLVLMALIDGLSAIRGTMSWLILSGIGSSIPFGPWNMGVLWVTLRGWGIGNAAATSGIALYGITNTLGILCLPLAALTVLTVAGAFGERQSTAAWLLAIGCAIVAFIVVAVIVAIVRSHRIASWIGRSGQRIADWLLARLGRSGGPQVERSVMHFRDQLGSIIRRRGLAGLLLALLAQVMWIVVLVAALRIVGVDEATLPVGRIVAVYCVVMVVMILPIAPGGAGIPELMFIGILSALAESSAGPAIAAGVFLYRIYYWFVPIPLAWAMLKVARRGKPVLPGATELREMASGSGIAAADAGLA